MKHNIESTYLTYLYGAEAISLDTPSSRIVSHCGKSKPNRESLIKATYKLARIDSFKIEKFFIFWKGIVFSTFEQVL